MDTPYERKVFAHLLALDCACPGCGEVYAGPVRSIREAINKTKARSRRKYRFVPTRGYDPTTGRFTCPRCERTWILGVVFWPIGKGGLRARPIDTIPNIPQAIALREAASRSGLLPRTDLREPVNRVEEDPLEAPDVAVAAGKDDPLIE